MYQNLSATSLSTALLNVPLNATLLNDEHYFRLNKINEIKGYFVAEVKKEN